ncbi:hypothetical protein AAMO2058_000682200 [Amorphochlora amoebiformis]
MTSSHVNQLSRRFLVISRVLANTPYTPHTFHPKSEWKKSFRFLSRSKSGSKGKFGVKEYLDDYRYHIEYGGYLSNHAKHAVIALEGLGVSEERIGNYFDFYRKKHGLEPAIESKNAIDKTNWKKYIGEKKYFMDYVEFFDKEEKRLGMEGLINTYMPQLIDGCVSALHHCTIHLGWALHAKNRLMIIEGLAYFAFAHVPTHLPSSKEFKARQDSSVLDTLKAIAAAAESSQLSKWTDKVFADPKYSAERFHPELKDTGLQWRTIYIYIYVCMYI